MRIFKAFRFRVYPDARQVERLHAWQSALRFLWNIALEQRRMGLARCGDDKRYPTAFDQNSELTALRAELPWLADVPRNVCTQLLVELDKAWQRCFAKLTRAPRWKRKGLDALGLCEPHPKAWRLDGSQIRFPKLGNLRAVVHREPVSKPKTCTLREEAGQWFASLVYEAEIVEPAPRTTPVVALDRGVVNVIADSDGNIVENPRHLDAAAARLARAQRNVSRKKKGSKNREKAKRRVAVLHRKVRRQREHMLHNISARLSKSHAIVVVEKLQIGNMVKANSGLARKHPRRRLGAPCRATQVQDCGARWRRCRGTGRLLLADLQRMRTRRRREPKGSGRLRVCRMRDLRACRRQRGEGAAPAI